MYETEDVIKQYGSYASVEYKLEGMSADEINEMYLNGKLDDMYDEIERRKGERHWATAKNFKRS